MILEKIISMANETVRLQFTAMERSLRAAGCKLPLLVIPYDHRRFELPPNCSWWLDEDVSRWLDHWRAHPTMRKYQCLLEGKYHFVDADVVFLRDPSEVLANFDGVVTCCTEWNKPVWTYTAASASYLYKRSSTWQRRVFSTGQFAIDQPLYSRERLMRTAESAEFIDACIKYSVHEQPGLNQLVLATDVPMINLTLPPTCMESSSALDYPAAFEHLWQDAARKPYMIHWAGSLLDVERPINNLFYSFLRTSEREDWDRQQRAKRIRRTAEYRARLPIHLRAAHDLKQAARKLLSEKAVDRLRTLISPKAQQ